MSVTLAEKKKLRFVRGAHGAVALAGELDVTLANTGPALVRLVPKHEVHGLVFTPKAGGKPIILVRDCQCMRDGEPNWLSYGAVQGHPSTIKINDWGCEGETSPTPPPGRYLVTYRTLVYPDPLPRAPERSRVPGTEIIKQCHADITSDAYWKNAIVSNPIEITLAPAAR